MVGEALREGGREPGHIISSFAQGRHVDRENTQPIVQVLAELSFLYRGEQIAVGRGDHAHVDFAGLRAADRLELALLQHAQQLALQVERQLADLVEEERAAVGQGEAAVALAASRR